MLVERQSQCFLSSCRRWGSSCEPGTPGNRLTGLWGIPTWEWSQQRGLLGWEAEGGRWLLWHQHESPRPSGASPPDRESHSGLLSCHLHPKQPWHTNVGVRRTRVLSQHVSSPVKWEWSKCQIYRVSGEFHIHRLRGNKKGKEKKKRRECKGKLWWERIKITAVRKCQNYSQRNFKLRT